MTAQPLDTHYASHRFRSRLEARWAVFFDTLNIPWQYEPEAYHIGPYPTDMTDGGATLREQDYLPDFWLPREGIWAEIERSEDELNIELLVHAALPDRGLPRAPNPYVVDEHEVRMLILGPLGQGVRRVVDQATREHVGYTQPTHSALAFRKGNLLQATAHFSSSGLIVDVGDGIVANDGSEIFWRDRGAHWGNLVGGGFMLTHSCDQAVAAAYRAANSARFEDGV